jgi:hypothetical protein
LEFPWDKKLVDQKARLILKFDGHSDIWIYYPEFEEAQRWQDYLIKERVCAVM